ncbi:MAG TPA: hypothetical protein VFK48_08380 [Usitatibacter sp.]|nr:hypothetical protein [Usitatibacter sp.]
MGLLGKIIAAKATAAAVNKMNNRYKDPTPEYIPAGQGVPATTSRTGMSGLGANATAIADRAGRFYRENPKLVGTVGIAAALMVLSRLKQR